MNYKTSIGTGDLRLAIGPTWPPLRSHLAEYYRRACGSDWRDYHEAAYTDDGPSPHEDCEHCFGTRGEHWEDCQR